LVVIEDGCTLRELDNLVKKYKFHGFPVVKDVGFIGYVTRDKLMVSIESLLSQEPVPLPTRRCTFLSRQRTTQDDLEDLSDVVEEAVLQLRKEQPQELVVDMFQKLNLRQILFTHEGKLTGMVTKTDIVALLNLHFPHTAALPEPPGHL